MASAQVSERGLPMTYIALRRWEHNRFWLNWNERSTLIDGDVLWAHYTRSAERSDYVRAVRTPRTIHTDARVPTMWGGTIRMPPPVLRAERHAHTPHATPARHVHPPHATPTRHVHTPHATLTCPVDGRSQSHPPPRFDRFVHVRMRARR